MSDDMYDKLWEKILGPEAVEEMRKERERSEMARTEASFRLVDFFNGLTADQVDIMLKMLAPREGDDPTLWNMKINQFVGCLQFLKLQRDSDGALAKFEGLASEA